MVYLDTSLSVPEAVQRIRQVVERGAVSIELIDNYHQSSPGGSLAVLVFEKYYMRTSSRASLTVTVSNLDGRTRVRAVGSGGGTSGLFSFDWGASEDFETSVAKALQGT